jgi:hypothetical protein
LGVLRAEVENEHALGGEVVLLHRAGDYSARRASEPVACCEPYQRRVCFT